MTFNIRKSSTYDSKPGQLRLRKDGLGGNLLLRGKFPGEDNFPPYTPELVTNGLIYHVEFKDTEYSLGKFYNKVDPSQWLNLANPVSNNFQDGLLHLNYDSPSVDQSLQFSSFPASFPTGTQPITISMWFMPTYINNDPASDDTFIFSAQGLKDYSREGELLIRFFNASSIRAKNCRTTAEIELTSPVNLQTNSKYHVTFQHENSYTALSVKKDFDLLSVVTTNLDSNWNVLKSTPPDETPIYVGGKEDPVWTSVSGPNFTGYLGAMLIYNRSLTQQEIVSNDTYFSGLFANISP